MTEKILQLQTEKTLFWTLVAILFLCAGFYMYSINTTIRNVVSRQNLENEATQLTLNIGTEEYKSISLRNGITLSLAHSLGFRDVSEKTFISRNTTSYVSYLTR